MLYFVDMMHVKFDSIQYSTLPTIETKSGTVCTQLRELILIFYKQLFNKNKSKIEISLFSILSDSTMIYLNVC